MFAKTLLAAATATAVTLGGATIAAAEDGKLVIHRGHVDVLYTELDGDDLKLGLQERFTTEKDITRDAEDVVFKITSDWWQDLTGTTNQDEISGRAALASEVWHDGNIWPGWDNNALKGKADEVSYTFTNISGPGTMFVYQTANNGLTDYAPKYSSGKMAATSVLTDGSFTLKSGDVMKTGAEHLHMNWAFTSPGTYTVTAVAEAGNKVSNPATYTFEVEADNGGNATSTDNTDNAETNTDEKITADKPKDDTKKGSGSSKIGTGGIVGIVLAVLGVLGAIIAAFANPMITFPRM